MVCGKLPATSIETDPPDFQIRSLADSTQELRRKRRRLDQTLRKRLLPQSVFDLPDSSQNSLPQELSREILLLRNVAEIIKKLSCENTQIDPENNKIYQSRLPDFVTVLFDLILLIRHIPAVWKVADEFILIK